MDSPPPLVLYASKYGSTRRYATELARVLGGQAADVASSLPPVWVKAPLLVLGSPIYGPSVLPAMEGFCQDHRGALAGSPLAAFVVCGDTVWIPRAREGGSGNLEKLTRILPRQPFATAVFGGVMRMEELDGTDRPAIEAFYRRLGRPATGFDRMDLSAAAAFAVEVLSRGTGR